MHGYRPITSLFFFIQSGEDARCKATPTCMFFFVIDRKFQAKTKSEIAMDDDRHSITTALRLIVKTKMSSSVELTNPIASLTNLIVNA